MRSRALSVALGAGVLAVGLAAPTCGNGSGTTSTTASSSIATAGSGGAGGAGGSGGAGGAGGCTPTWTCTPWETDGTTDAATRTCTDSAGCGSMAGAPIASAMLPDLDLDWFECNVEPILDRKCAMLGCHGTEKGRALRVYARARKRLAGELLANPTCGAGATPADGCDGSNACLCAAPHTANEWRKNYDAARGFALNDLGMPIPAASMASSELLSQPVVGGATHGGIHLFKKNDADYTAIKSWLTGSKLGMACVTGNN